MSRVQRLLQAYTTFIEIPWDPHAAAAQRVIFCVYPQEDELRLRAALEEFELATRQAGHHWLHYDLTDRFPQWLTQHKYAHRYFKQPELLPMPPPGFEEHLTKDFSDFVTGKAAGSAADSETVVTLSGVGSLFQILKVKQVVENFAPLVPGRLLVLFPGTYENQNYRLLDGYDGWNYLAVPITTETR